MDRVGWAAWAPVLRGFQADHRLLPRSDKDSLHAYNLYYFD